MRRKDALIFILVIVLIGAVVAAIFIPTYRPVPAQVPLSSGRVLSCPVGDQSLGTTKVTITDAQSFTASLVGDAVLDPAPLMNFDNPAKPIVARGTPLISGVSTFTQDNKKAAIPCATPVSYGAWNGLTLTDQTATLVVSNTDSTASIIDVFLYGVAGQIPVGGISDITVDPQSTKMLSINQLTQSATPVTVVMRASKGRVMAFMRVISDAGMDWELPQTTPGTQLFITGVPAGDGTRTLFITNTQDQRATLTITGIGEDGTYPLLGSTQVSIDAKTVISVDLTQPLNQGSASIRIDSTQNLTASVVAADSDFAAIPASAALGEAIAFPAVGGTLWLTNPEFHDVELSMQTDDGQGNRTMGNIEIPAQSLIPVEFPAQGRVVLLAQNASTVHAAVVVTEGGLSVLPLVSGGFAVAVNSPPMDPALG